jgi:hypothetical protein
MRFCRACGYRLGEGVEDYTATVRLPGTADTRAGKFGAQGFGQIPTAGPMAVQGTTPIGVAGTDRDFQRWCRKRRRSRWNWMIWVIMIFAFMSVSGGLLSAIRFSPSSRRIERRKATSFIGVDSLKNAPNGATFNAVTPPGSPADKAGLVGGDTITAVDGKEVKSSDQMRSILNDTPPGKTVDVTYIRDGETKTTKLTTISTDASSGLDEAFERRTEGKGELGISSLHQVDVPGMNIKGVLVGDTERNYPAEMAGIQKGDIIITYDGVPIRTSDELRSRIRRTIPKTKVIVTVVRGTDKQDIPVVVGQD